MTRDQNAHTKRGGVTMWHIQYQNDDGRWITRIHCPSKWTAEQLLDQLQVTMRHYDYRRWRVVYDNIPARRTA